MAFLPAALRQHCERHRDAVEAAAVPEGPSELNLFTELRKALQDQAGRAQGLA